MAAITLFITCAVSAELQQPDRTIGYFIGDILQQKIGLNPGERVVLDADMESGERVGEYLYRLPVEMPAEPTWIGRQLNRMHRLWAALYDGGQSDRLVLDIRYQVINVPPVTQTNSLPKLVLMTDSDATVVIPAWQFNLGPLTQDAAAGTQVIADRQQSIKSVGPQLLPDRTAAEMFDVRGARKFKARLAVLAGLLSLLLLCWLLWWVYRNFRDRRVLPFATARSAIRALPRSQRKSDDAAWRILHAAFNDTAGRTIGAGSLSALLQRAPWLNAVSDDVELFYRASAERFFRQSDSAPEVNVGALAEALFQLEKRQVPSARSSAALERSSSPTGAAVDRSRKDNQTTLAD